MGNLNTAKMAPFLHNAIMADVINTPIRELNIPTVLTLTIIAIMLSPVWNLVFAGIKIFFHPLILLLSECYDDFENLLSRIFIDPSPSVSDSESWQMNRRHRDDIVALITSGVVRLLSVLGAVPITRKTEADPFRGYITLEEADRRMTQRIKPIQAAYNLARQSAAHLNTGWTNANGLIDELTVQLLRLGDTGRLEAAAAKEENDRLKGENNELRAKNARLTSEWVVSDMGNDRRDRWIQARNKKIKSLISTLDNQEAARISSAEESMARRKTAKTSVKRLPVQLAEAGNSVQSSEQRTDPSNVDLVPTLAPTSVSAPTTTPSQTLTTRAPSPKVPSPPADNDIVTPTTRAPSPVPVAPVPSPVPITPAPSPVPVASVPSPIPVTPAPSPVPVASVPSPIPATPAPSPVPVASIPSPIPVTPAPSPVPVASVPSPIPVTLAPSPPVADSPMGIPNENSSSLFTNPIAETTPAPVALSVAPSTSLTSITILPPSCSSAPPPSSWPLAPQNCVASDENSSQSLSQRNIRPLPRRTKKVPTTLGLRVIKHSKPPSRALPTAQPTLPSQGPIETMDVDANIAEEDAVPTVQPTPPSRGPMITMDLDPNIAEEEAVDDYLYSNEPRMEVDNPVAASALSVPEAVPDFMDVDDAELLGDAPPMQPETRAAPALVPAPAPFVIPGLMTSEPSAGPSSAMSQGEKDAGLLSKLERLAAKRGLLNPSPPPPPDDLQASMMAFTPAKPKLKMQMMSSSSAMSMMAQQEIERKEAMRREAEEDLARQKEAAKKAAERRERERREDEEKRAEEKRKSDQCTHQ